MTYKSPRIQHYGVRATDVLRGGHKRFRYHEDEGLSLPIVYVCKGCGHELYRTIWKTHTGESIDFPMPVGVARKLGGHCPKCHREIDGEVEIDSIKVAEAT